MLHKLGLFLVGLVLPIYVRFMGMLDEGIAAGESWFICGHSYADIVAKFTPGGLWAAYIAYWWDPYEPVITNKPAKCNCLGCRNMDTLMRAMTIYEAGYDNIQWVNDTLHAYNAGEFPTGCNDPRFVDLGYGGWETTIPNILAYAVLTGAATLEPGGTAPTLKMTEAEKALCEGINQELGL